MAYSDAVLALSPVAYWRLGEASGTTANDEVGSLDGTYVGGVTLGAPSLLTGDSDTAVALNGTSGEITVGDDAALDFGNGPFSLSLWVKFGVATETRYNGLLDKGSFFLHRKPSNHGSFPNKIAFGKTGGSTVLGSTTAIADTNAHFIVLTYNGGTTGRVYIDGVEGTSQGSTQTIVDTNDALHIGFDIGNSAFLNGTIDEVALFDAVLTAQQIADLYAAAESEAQTVSPSSISSAEAFGSTVLQRGTVNLVASGIASSEAFGSSEITAIISVNPSGIVSAELFGSHAVNLGPMTVEPSSITSDEAFGTAIATTGTVTVSSSGIASAESFGDTVVSTGELTVSPDSIESEESVSNPTVAAGVLTLAVAGVNSQEAFGSLSVQSVITVSPTGVVSTEEFGDAEISQLFIVSPAGISSAEVFSNPEISVGVVITQAITSAEAFGSTSVEVGTVTILATAIDSGEAFGTAIVFTGERDPYKWNPQDALSKVSGGSWPQLREEMRH